MKTAVVLMLAVMLVGMASVEAVTLRKRFLDSAGDSYNSAKDAFNKVAQGVDFDATVDALIPYIHSDMTVIACTAVCVGAASSVLGPAALLAGVVCAPLCEGALAKLEETAG